MLANCQITDLYKGIKQLFYRLKTGKPDNIPPFLIGQTGFILLINQSVTGLWPVLMFLEFLLISHLGISGFWRPRFARVPEEGRFFRFFGEIWGWG
jgi:hypothetical protein